jgi:hypothetical protein
MPSGSKGIFRILASLFLGGLLQWATTASAEDRDFSRLVKEIELRFHAKRMHVPVFGLAKPILKVVPPSGAKSLEMAIFEDQDFSGIDSKAFAELAGNTLGPEWHLMIQVVSRRDGEQTLIYVREAGDQYRLIVATLEPNEAVLTEVKISSKDLFKLIDRPEEMDKTEEDETE